jgi:3-methyladenine DNA glycosylase/8-oxoguanine DNA glycosylase
MPVELTVRTPKGFDFLTTVRGHGWYDLAPFVFNEPAGELRYVFTDWSGQKAVAGIVSGRPGELTVRLPNRSVQEAKVIRDVRHILRLDDDMAEFYDAARREERLHWAAEIGAGRLLRSPTVFEDAVKTMCTTNCSWALTRKMVANLVEKLGIPAAWGEKAFPTPAAMASVDDKFYREEIRAGYRSPYFVEFAEAVASGGLDPEAWPHSDLPTLELRKEIKAVKGFGDYAADNLLKLLGRYDGLALDSWLREEVPGQAYRKTLRKVRQMAGPRDLVRYDRVLACRGPMMAFRPDINKING